MSTYLLITQSFLPSFPFSASQAFPSFYYQEPSVYSSSHFRFCILFHVCCIYSCIYIIWTIFIKKCFVRFILSFTALCPTSPWFFHRKPFVLSKQTLICTSHSKLQQGCQVSILTPARNSCSSGPEYAVLLPYGALVRQTGGTKPWAQMFALLAGSPKSSCLLIDDNLHNDTMHSDAARHEEAWELPMPSLAGWQNPYLPACRQQRQQEPGSVWFKDAHYNPSNFNTGWVGGGLPVLASKFTKKPIHRYSACSLYPYNRDSELDAVNKSMVYG